MVGRRPAGPDGPQFSAGRLDGTSSRRGRFRPVQLCAGLRRAVLRLRHAGRRLDRRSRPGEGTRATRRDPRHRGGAQARRRRFVVPGAAGGRRGRLAVGDAARGNRRRGVGQPGIRRRRLLVPVERARQVHRVRPQPRVWRVGAVAGVAARRRRAADRLRLGIRARSGDCRCAAGRDLPARRPRVSAPAPGNRNVHAKWRATRCRCWSPASRSCCTCASTR